MVSLNTLLVLLEGHGLIKQFAGFIWKCVVLLDRCGLIRQVVGHIRQDTSTIG